MKPIPKIPKYAKDRSIDIGKSNLKKLEKGKGLLKFTGVYIHLSPTCNFNCEGCFTGVQRDNELKDKRLSFKQITRIVDFAKDRGAKIIIFAGAGEPLLDSEFEKTSSYIKNKGLETLLFTNCTLIKSVDIAKKLLLNGPVIGKLMTLNKEKYDKLVGKVGAFEETMKGLNYLITARNELKKEDIKVTLGVDAFISQSNKEDMKEVLKFCRKNELLPYLEAFIVFSQPKELVKNCVLSERELTNLFIQLKEIDKKEFGINTKIKSWSRTYGQDPCFKATHMFAVKNNGKVFMCICSLREVGDIFYLEDPYKSLEKIFDIKNKELLNVFKCDFCSARINPKLLRG